MAVLDFGLPRKASNRRATVRSHLETGHRSDVLPVKFNLLSTKNLQKQRRRGASVFMSFAG